MIKKINSIYKFLPAILIFSASSAAAQTGFFTPNPVHPLQIDSSKDNGAAPDAAKLSNDVVATADGKLGVGLLNPITKVDVRSPDNKGIIGLGTNAQAANVAGAGAIRYNVGGFLEYSDGEQWIALPLAPPTKALVNASKSTAQNITTGTSTFITGWTETVDVGNNFNNNDTFTAPRDGFYLVSFSITLASGNIPKNTFIETAIESSQVTDNIPVYKTVNSYPAFQAGAVSNYISGNCNAIFNLKKDDTIKFSIKHNIGSTRSILSDGNLNNLSISEL